MNNCRKFTLLSTVIFWLPLKAQNVENLSLKDAALMAIEKNLEIRLARIDSEMAELANHLGEAGFLPEFNISMNANESNQDINLTFFSGETIERDGAKSSGISGVARADWTLFDGMKMFATRDRLRALEEISKQQLKWKIEEIVSEVTAAYAEILIAEKLLEFHKGNLRYSQRLYEIAKDKEGQGIGNRGEVLRLAADYYADSSMTIRQESDVSAQKHRFCHLIGIAPTDGFELAPLPAKIFDFNLGTVLEKLENQNPELIINSYQKTAAEKQVREEQSVFLPTLGSFGEYQNIRQVNEVGVLERNLNQGFNYGLRLQWNLFNGNRDRRYVQQARLMTDRLEIEREDLSRKIRAEAIALWKEYVAAGRIIEIERRSNALAEENLEISLQRFERGISEDIEVREARRNLTEAQLRLLQAESERYATSAELLKLSGEGRIVFED
ncbi:MAG: TolC family protein [Cryomorphaceae bacterium]|nr:TolC family protein [Cryomorphaceae bacterium]